MVRKFRIISTKNTQSTNTSIIVIETLSSMLNSNEIKKGVRKQFQIAKTITDKSHLVLNVDESRISHFFGSGGTSVVV